MKLTYQYSIRVINSLLFVLLTFFIFVTDYDKQTGHWYLLLLFLTCSWMFDTFLAERIKSSKLKKKIN
ncbi:MAG: hypothetical protein K9J16_12275 [Melioribacteraceae bacterium]|nr:hypothetical protein [Melioribacteraceae bacterium]MCF8354604.1 hypothetical protein [Melioribacteraceae bacterium]MCF8396361.1 hypothetical protein [Melioribacteraceae bacterium]MCF8420181.1 hypothetical protein [Melioribacteraceae bacterium]